MKRIVLAVIILIPAIGFSQKIKKVRPAPQWDTLYYKNEFSLDVSPAVAFIAGSIRSRESVGCTYRRFLDKNDAIRIGMRHGFDSYSYQQTEVPEGNSWFQLYRDSVYPIRLGDTVVVGSNFRTNYYSPDLRVGYEHRFGKRRFKCMLGLDALIGIERINTTEQKNYFVFQATTDTLGTNYYLTATSNQYAPSYQNIATNLKVGLTPFMGLQVHLSKRFSLNATAMLDMFWTVPLKGKPKYTDFNLNADALASDIGLTVHF
jgi:hypothetical protein